MKGKILVLGGTGALGSYLTPELLRRGFRVHVVSLDETVSRDPDLSCERADAKDDAWLRQALRSGYDAIVDYMSYGTEEFSKRYSMMLDNTSQYVFLSSYRVYADSHGPITEDSPRLLDAGPNDPEFMASNDYALEKARQENLLLGSGRGNWTILRPAITFSSGKFQLTTMEANSFVNRALAHKITVLPEIAMEKQATLSWSGDVGRMTAGLVLNDRAYGETYTVSTAEHHTWREIAEYYRELIGMAYVTADTETFLWIFDSGSAWGRWRLMYDRAYDRIVDNRKILRDTGLNQADFMSVKDALRRELSGLSGNESWCHCDIGGIRYAEINGRMDAYIESLRSKK